MSDDVAYFVFGILLIALLGLSAYELFCMDSPECYMGIPGAVILGVIIFDWLSDKMDHL